MKSWPGSNSKSSTIWTHRSAGSARPTASRPRPKASKRPSCRTPATSTRQWPRYCRPKATADSARDTMAHPILMPKPGQMTEECVLVAWLKNEGDVVKKGDVLFEIETDKSNMDVEAFEEGVLLKQVVTVGQTVPVNAVCAYVGEPGEAIPETVAAPVAVTPAPAPTPAAASTPAVAPVAVALEEVAAAPSVAGEVRLRISPRASRLAADSGIDPRTITGSGPEGRITERDVKAAMAAPKPAAPAVAPATPAPRPV